MSARTLYFAHLSLFTIGVWTFGRSYRGVGEGGIEGGGMIMTIRDNLSEWRGYE